MQKCQLERHVRGIKISTYELWSNVRKCSIRVPLGVLDVSIMFKPAEKMVCTAVNTWKSGLRCL